MIVLAETYKDIMTAIVRGSELLDQKHSQYSINTHHISSLFYFNKNGL